MQRALKNGNLYANLFVLLVSLILVILNVCRIMYVPVTHDEAITFIHFLPLTYSDIVNCHPPSPANHILNTVFVKFFSALFHSRQPLVLRLPNLLAEIIFLLSCYGLMRRLFNKPIWRAGCFIVINLNPFMFEFWGLARGYGLALAFMMCCIYCFITYAQQNKYIFLWLSFLFGIGSVYSNFSLLNFYVAFNAVVIIHTLLYPLVKENVRHLLLKELPVLLLADVLLYIMVDVPIRVLRSENKLNYGGSSGIISDTVRSLVMQSLFIDNRKNIIVVTIAYVIVISIVIIGIYWIRKYLHEERNTELVTGMLLWLLLVVPILFRLIQHISSHAKFQLDRTALFLIPLYMMHPVYWHYYRNRHNRHQLSPFLLLICCFITFNFCRHINFRNTRLWPYDEYVVQTSKRIISETKGIKDVKIAADKKLIPALSFYLNDYYKTDISVDSLAASTAPCTGACYYYVFYSEQTNVQPLYIKDAAYSYPSDTVLLYHR